MPESTKDKPYSFYLNDEPVEVLPQWALDKMAENLSRVVSLHFMQHPDEYERYLNSKEHQEYLKKRGYGNVNG